MATIHLTEKSLVSSCQPPSDEAQAYYWDTELTGLGVVVGRSGTKTFVARGWIAGFGAKRKVTIGVAGRPTPEGTTWTVKLARIEARKILGKMSAGEVPQPTRRKSSSATTTGPTLRTAFDAHITWLTKQVKAGKRSQETIDTFEKSKNYLEDSDRKYAGNVLDMPIAELSGELLRELHDKIKTNARRRGNTRNEPGAALANRVITNVGTAWASLNRELDGKLGTWNPSKSVRKDPLVAKRVRVDDLADWYARVQTMRNAIQRDGLLFALFTGLRSEDVRSIRYEHVDERARTLQLLDPKGGEARAFTLPLSKTCMNIIAQRRKENSKALLIAEAGGDAGYVFPGLNSDGDIGPISDLRQQVHEGTKHSRFPSEDVHTLRREYLTVAQEAGISELDQHVLSNHSFGSHNVNASYISQHIDHLAECQAKIEAALWARIKAKAKTAKNKTKRTA